MEKENGLQRQKTVCERISIRISISLRVSYGACDALKAGHKNQEVFGRSFGGLSQGQEAVRDNSFFIISRP